MNKKSILAGFVLAAVVALTGCGQERAGVQAQSSQTASVPTPNTSMMGSDTVTIFDRATVALPTSWGAATGVAGVVVDFADKTSCSGSNADCPHVVFVNLASPKAKEYYGEDIVQYVADQPCEHGPMEVRGPAKLAIDGEQAEFYQRICGPEKEYTTYSWYVPSKKFFVYTINEQGGQSPEVAQAVLNGLRWEQN